MMQAINQWGQGPSGFSQRFANPGLYDIQIASDSLQRSVDPDTADKIQKHTDKIIAAASPDTPGLRQSKRAQGGNVVATKQGEQFNPYKKPPHNNASNDYHQGYQEARGSGDYSFGKVSPRFQNDGAEIEPQGHDKVRRRSGTTEDYLRPAQRRAYERDNRFAKGG